LHGKSANARKGCFEGEEATACSAAAALDGKWSIETRKASISVVIAFTHRSHSNRDSARSSMRLLSESL